MKRFHILLPLFAILAAVFTVPVRGEEFEPDFESVVFVPKGQWVTGVSVSYSQSTERNYQFLVMEGINSDSYSFKVSPMVMYVFKNDMGFGGKFGYNRSLTKVENAGIVFDPETSIDVDHLYKLSHSYYGMAIMRNYFSLGKSKRFGIFTELQFEMGGGQAKLMTGVGEELSGNFQESYNIGVGLAPGMAIFLNNFAALEVNVGVLGFEYKHTNTLTNQIYNSYTKTKDANFRVNLFSITFGVSFYL